MTGFVIMELTMMLLKLAVIGILVYLCVTAIRQRKYHDEEWTPETKRTRKFAWVGSILGILILLN